MKFCWHKWLPWSDPIQTYSSGHKQQWRVCAHCNKAQFRTLWWDKQSSVSDIHKAITKVKEKLGARGETK